MTPMMLATHTGPTRSERIAVGRWKASAAQSQDAQDEGEDERFLEIQSLQQGGEHAGGEQPEGDVVGRLDPAEQAHARGSAGPGR